MFNTVYIHAGLPKTGSSYLQHALELLSKSNRLEVVHYPIKKETQAFSGNGVSVATQLVPELFPTFMPEQLEQELEELLEGCESIGGDLLISSEDFFSASPERFDYFKKLLLKYAENIKLIIVVRPIDSWVYSYYMQMVKRHGASSGFTTEWLEQFKEEIFQKLQSIDRFEVETLVLPYSSTGLLRAFLKVMGESRELANEVPDVRVNRSLTQRELKILERVNSIFGCARLSELISDEFIRLDSEGSSEPLSADLAAFYMDFRNGFEAKICNSLGAGNSSSGSKVIKDVKPILFAEIDDQTLVPSAQAVKSDELLFDSVLPMIKLWMDEGGDLFRIRNFAAKNLNPTVDFFDPVHYLVLNKDVLRLGVDPWRHYQKNGKGEGRDSAYVRADIDF